MMTTQNEIALKMPPPSIDGQVRQIFDQMQANRHALARTTARERIDKLERLCAAILAHRVDFHEAMYKDFRKNEVEVDTTELFPSVSEIRYALRHLRSWMRERRVSTPIPLLGTSSWVKPEPKGVSLIIAPWNYPIFLAFYPLVSAIAAGNAVILKPSEVTPHTSAAIKKVIESVFSSNEIAVVEGDVAVSTALLKLKFDHIFFTGAPSIGKIVMRAAAENLTSVTLELGGKSPAVVDESANIEATAKRLTFGKITNCGQVCIAPDYVLVHESVKNQLVEALKRELETQVGKTTADRAACTTTARIVNNRHFDRVMGYLEDGKKRGGNILFGGNSNPAENYIEPTLIENLPDDSLLMQEEIFGPILPIKTYQNLDEAIRYINSKEKPLALYIFSSNKKNTNTILENTSAGGTLINDVLLHIANHALPFGGVNNSGIGKGHGKYGFDEFSNQKAVMKQHFSRSAIELLHMPYSKWSKRLADLLLKYF